MPDRPAPPFDGELAIVLASLADRVPPTLTADMIARFRALPPDPTVGGMVDEVGAVHERRVVPGFADGMIEASIFRPAESPPGPGILYLHGGGMVFGNRFGGVGAYLPLIASHGAVVVAIDYRLAPEHPAPTPVEDGYAALVWTASHAKELGIDPARMIVAGQSAGAGLAAGVALLARERGGPALAAQVLVSPMLDDRNDSVSAQQIDGIGVWDRTSNLTGWTALLGDRRGERRRARRLGAEPGGKPPRPASGVPVGRQRGGVPRRDRGVRIAHLGLPAGSRNCTSGPAGSTASRTSPPPQPSPPTPPPPAIGGSGACWTTEPPGRRQERTR